MVIQFAHRFGAPVCAAVLACGLFGCVTSAVTTFTPQQNQDAIVRDGVAALVSRKPGSVVLVRQAQRQREAGSRPEYVIGILNTSKAPINFVVGPDERRGFRDGSSCAVSSSFGRLRT